MNKTTESNSMLENHDTLFQVGVHQLKNGWTLTVSKYEGHYEIRKQNVYGIWAIRDTGGGFGDGNWTIRILNSVGAENNYIDIAGGFTLEVVNLIIDTMELLMVKYNIKNYGYKPVNNSISEDKSISGDKSLVGRMKLIIKRLCK